MRNSSDHQGQERYTAHGGRRWILVSTTRLFRVIVTAGISHFAPAFLLWFKTKTLLMMPYMYNRSVVLLIVALLSFLCAHQVVWAADGADVAANQKDPKPIQLISGDGMNLKIVEQIDAHYVIVKVDPPVHNWFAGTFTNLPTDTGVTIGLSMTGNDTEDNKADVSKWVGLCPVMTYADPTNYETYEWFQKDDQGRWVSGDPFKEGDAKYAGTGKVPVQSVIPVDVADEFLSDNGRYWQPWREVDNAEAVPTLNIFRVKQRFILPTVTVAMRIPYTYTYQQHLLERLSAAKLPAISIDVIGNTGKDRKLQAIKYSEPLNVERVTAIRPTILVYSREHATENASSWGAIGVLFSLLSLTEELDKNKSNVDWIIIPILDPDGSIDGYFDRITERFSSLEEIEEYPEILSFANYLIDYIDREKPITFTVAWHNIEANEFADNVCCPFVDQRSENAAKAFNESFFNKSIRQGIFIATRDPWNVGLVDARLNGWCSRHFGSTSLVYEINDRSKNHRMDLHKTINIGSLLATVLTEWSAGEEGKRCYQLSQAALKKREGEKRKYFRHLNRLPETHTNAEIILLGY